MEFGRPVRFVGPNPRDVRLHQSAVLLSLQVLGQTVLGFELSVAQLLLSLGVCAAIEVGARLWRERVIAWPASALLTGNGVALILRVPGTRHGDWWSLNGWWIFVIVAAASLLSKYALRRDGRHVFNPSNLGLVTAFLVLGNGRVDPQALWWGDLDVGLFVAIALILVGGVVITGRLRLLAMAVTFWVVLASLTGALSASGHCMTAPWHVGPVCGGSYWWTLAFSPEVFVFAMFMITDPRTTPSGRRARLVFGGAVGVLGALLVAPQRTEYATKVGLLASLVVVCAAVSVLRSMGRRGVVASHTGGPVRSRTIGIRALVTLAVVAVLVVAAGAPARPGSFVQRDLAVAGEAAPVLPAGFPTVLLDESTTRLASWYTTETAERRALDLVVDLDLLAEAAESGAIGLARAAATGTALAEVEARLARDASLGRREVVRYHLHTITAVMVRAPGSDQPGPEVGYEIAGARTTTVLDTSTTPPTVRSTVTDVVREAWRLRAVGDIPRSLIVGAGERWETGS